MWSSAWFSREGPDDEQYYERAEDEEESVKTSDSIDDERKGRGKDGGRTFHLRTDVKLSDD